MSWEETGRSRYPCPCGAGEYEVVSRSDDWGHSDQEVSMLCPQCRTKYRYVVTGYHGADSIEEWVSAERLAAAKQEREQRIARTRADCLSIWRAKVSVLRTKKAIWDFATRTESGSQNRAYGTFLKDHRGQDLDRIRAESERVFGDVSAHPMIYAKCGITNHQPRPDFLVEHSA
jgi:hypothetical protein